MSDAKRTTHIDPRLVVDLRPRRAFVPPPPWAHENPWGGYGEYEACGYDHDVETFADSSTADDVELVPTIVAEHTAMLERLAVKAPADGSGKSATPRSGKSATSRKGSDA